MSAKVPQTTTAESEEDNLVHEDFRSGAKLAGELADEFNHIETTDSKSGGDRFTVRNESLTGDTFGNITEKAAKHGFRIRSVMDDGRKLAFTRIENHETDPRTEEV